MKKYFSFQSGFTLVEILVVIALIGTLGTWMISLIDPPQQFKKGRDAERKAELRQIQTALELYRADQAAYPVNLPTCDSPLTVDTSVYIQKIPCDPRNSGQQIYNYTSTGSTYILTACLENVHDSQKDAINDAMYCAGGDTNWSYTLINP